MLQQVWPWTEILCRNIVFYVATKFDQGQGISWRNKEFLCRYKVSWSGVATEFGQGQENLCRDIIFLCHDDRV